MIKICKGKKDSKEQWYQARPARAVNSIKVGKVDNVGTESPGFRVKRRRRPWATLGASHLSHQKERGLNSFKAAAARTYIMGRSRRGHTIPAFVAVVFAALLLFLNTRWAKYNHNISSLSIASRQNGLRLETPMRWLESRRRAQQTAEPHLHSAKNGNLLGTCAALDPRG